MKRYTMLEIYESDLLPCRRFVDPDAYRTIFEKVYLVFNKTDTSEEVKSLQQAGVAVLSVTPVTDYSV